MIRSSRHPLIFANKGKQEAIKQFVFDYRRMVNKYINILWNEYLKCPPSFLDSKICKSIKTNRTNDSRIRQCAAKQACGMIKSIVSKHNKRLYVLKELQRSGKNTKFLQRKIDNTILTKPNFENINVELDPRFIDFKDGNHFDLFIQVTEIGNKEKIRIPIKHTEVSQRWKNLGKLKTSIRLTKTSIFLYFEVEKPKVTGTKIVGADQGQITCLTISEPNRVNEQVTKKNKDGYDLNLIQDILSRRKKGSIGFRKSQTHRKNYINWSLNQLDFTNIKEVRYEKVKDIRKNKKSSRKSSHWTYTLIKSKLIGLSEDKGFIFIEQDNKFMSQRCSQCGFTHKSNRDRKTFKCLHCDNCCDSDLNAASNHAIDLVAVPMVVWYRRLNRTTGFYWFADKVVYCSEPIVPDVTIS